MGVETAHAAQCSNSCVLTKVIYFILDVESFEQHCVILKGLLQLDQIKQHMVTIGIDPLLSNCAM